MDRRLPQSACRALSRSRIGKVMVKEPSTRSVRINWAAPVPSRASGGAPNRIATLLSAKVGNPPTRSPLALQLLIWPSPLVGPTPENLPRKSGVFAPPSIHSRSPATSPSNAPASLWTSLEHGRSASRMRLRSVQIAVHPADGTRSKRKRSFQQAVGLVERTGKINLVRKRHFGAAGGPAHEFGVLRFNVVDRYGVQLWARRVRSRFGGLGRKANDGSHQPERPQTHLAGKQPCQLWVNLDLVGAYRRASELKSRRQPPPARRPQKIKNDRS